MFEGRDAPGFVQLQPVELPQHVLVRVVDDDPEPGPELGQETDDIGEVEVVRDHPDLGLRVGDPATALVKATSVMVIKGDE